MYAVLLQGQSVAVERPLRGPGAFAGLAAGALALALSAALAVRVAGWPVSWQLFLACLVAAVLFAVAALFFFWAYSCATLSYRMAAGIMEIRWGPVQHRVPLARVTGLFDGRPDDRVRVNGLNWWRHHIGRGEVEGIGAVIFYSTHRRPEELVYMETPAGIYGISPQQPARFAAVLRRFQEGASVDEPEPERMLRYNWLVNNAFWSDSLAKLLALGALAVGGAVAALVFAAYPDLDSRITIEFPPVGDITAIEPKKELLRLPAVAGGMLGMNLVAAFLLRQGHRAATHLLLAGSIFLQVLFLIAVAVALRNA